MLPGASPGELRDHRAEHGLAADIQSGYEAFFSPETLEIYLTGYSYANVNVTYEAVLEELHRLRTGDQAGAQAFRTRIQDKLTERALFSRENK